MLTPLLSSARIRACLNCGSWFGVSPFLCRPCHHRLIEKYKGSQVRLHSRLNCRFLLQWMPGESDLLSGLAHQMKKENLPAWQFWADAFTAQLIAAGQISSSETKKMLLISSESVTGSRHAQNWGESLGHVLGVQHRCLLRPLKSSILQKKAGMTGRRLRAFDCLEEISFSSDQKVIFVDDIVTSGYTALAAFKALREPPRFEVWSLLYREEKTS